MKISPRFVGLKLKEYRRLVDWRQSTNYAAAVGDDNPRYFDDERPGGIVAPPMLAVALTWQISVRLPQFLEAPDFPLEVFTRQVHYYEALEFHRLLRPGDALTIRGEVAAIRPHSSGAEFIVRYEASDGAENPVFTEYSGALLRGVDCEGDGQGWSPALQNPEIEQAPLWHEKLRVDRLAPYVYDGLTGIVFPIHTSPAFAKSVGLPGIIYQGTATLALAARELVNRECGGDPVRLKGLSCRFKGMVLPGGPITVRLLERRSDGSCFFDVLNRDGRKAVSPGAASLA